MNRHRNQTARGAFTLLEMMLVVVIIGLLATVVVWNFAGRSDAARRGTAIGSLRTLSQVIESHYTETGQYPVSIQALVPKYIPKVSKDPWKRDFVYYAPGQDGKPYALFSMGADGAANTPDDINVWTMDETPAE